MSQMPLSDWEFFRELVYEEGKWPRNVRNHPNDATILEAFNDGGPLFHHALLDARIIANMFSPTDFPL